MSYQRADFSNLAARAYGLSVHWTAKSMPRHGPAQGFADSVRDFALDDFVAQVAASGAEYVIFTITHALQKIAAPCAPLDAILPGRTTERDLLGEMAEALAGHGIALILYYNHSCNSGEDPDWERAVGYHDWPKDRFFANLCSIVGCLGERYGELVVGWWFDSSYSVDASGPHNSVTCDLRDWRFPWEDYTQLAKRGNPNRLVTYNAGVNQTHLYTAHQDYWAGELVDLDHPPQGPTAPNGLPWHGWTCLDDRRWVHGLSDREIPPPLYSDDELVGFLSLCRSHRAPMTFNVGIYQEGRMAEPSVAQLARVGRRLRT
jgi:hypothetical protein